MPVTQQHYQMLPSIAAQADTADAKEMSNYFAVGQHVARQAVCSRASCSQASVHTTDQGLRSLVVSFKSLTLSSSPTIALNGLFLW